MQAQKLDHALVALLGTGRDPRTDHPVYLTDAVRVDVDFGHRPTVRERRAVAALGGVVRGTDAEHATVSMPALSLGPLSDLPSVVKLRLRA